MSFPDDDDGDGDDNGDDDDGGDDDGDDDTSVNVCFVHSVHVFPR
jgi:hypothetical protein